jgi:hypothetical protein
MVTISNDLRKHIEKNNHLCIKTKSKQEEVKPKKKNRCTNCNKKTGLIPFSCKCGNDFCIKCRYAETHNCTYDWKTEARKKLEKDNPQIIAKKVENI